jgi:hypothetical protein
VAYCLLDLYRQITLALQESIAIWLIHPFEVSPHFMGNLDNTGTRLSFGTSRQPTNGSKAYLQTIMETSVGDSVTFVPAQAGNNFVFKVLDKLW